MQRTVKSYSVHQRCINFYKKCRFSAKIQMASIEIQDRQLWQWDMRVKRLRLRAAFQAKHSKRTENY